MSSLNKTMELVTRENHKYWGYTQKSYTYMQVNAPQASKKKLDNLRQDMEINFNQNIVYSADSYQNKFIVLLHETCSCVFMYSLGEKRQYKKTMLSEHVNNLTYSINMKSYILNVVMQNNTYKITMLTQVRHTGRVLRHSEGIRS